ncbi:hypothetical protein [Vulcanisaeta distributa]|uniref:hypothetical protein n=1 Tax=Vulcanisaeta distributa TaxID=164451 RepID=UPI001FB53C6B|nr:hypothetical protein [Vulcanisaeta distributa]
MIIAFSYYIYHAINGLSRLHRYAGIALMIGAILYIAIVGALIMIISYILLLIAWLTPNISMVDSKFVNFTRIHVIRIIAWSIALSLLALVTLSSLLSASLNPQYGGLDPVTGLVLSGKHPMEYMALLNYSLVDIGITNQTYVPNSILILGYVMVYLPPYYIKVSIGTNSCLDLITVAPTSTGKTIYSIPYEIPTIPPNPLGSESQVTYRGGTAVKTVIKADEVSWTYIPALSAGPHTPVPNGFLLTCMFSNYDYVFPINITIVAIVKAHSNYFITNYKMAYVKVSFMINRTAIRLINERSGSSTESSINYVNVIPMIYLPLFIYYIIYDHEFYRKLLI